MTAVLRGNCGILSSLVEFALYSGISTMDEMVNRLVFWFISENITEYRHTSDIIRTLLRIFFIILLIRRTLYFLALSSFL